MAKGNLEIERRFIMRGKPAEAPHEEYDIFQKYARDGWRYRRQAAGDNVQYFKTRKTAISTGANHEEEYEISGHAFHNDCGEVTKGIAKTRMVYNHAGHRFEVDHFHHLQLVIMEVELDDIAQPVDMPLFLRDLVIYEITGIKEFSNSSLALPGYLRR